jgi:hypothetical protein
MGKSRALPTPSATTPRVIPSVAPAGGLGDNSVNVAAAALTRSKGTAGLGGRVAAPPHTPDAELGFHEEGEAGHVSFLRQVLDAGELESGLEGIEASGGLFDFALNPVELGDDVAVGVDGCLVSGGATAGVDTETGSFDLGIGFTLGEIGTTLEAQDETGARTQTRLAVSGGPSIGLRQHAQDADGNGVPELGFGFDLGFVGFDYRSEELGRDMMDFTDGLVGVDGVYGMPGSENQIMNGRAELDARSGLERYRSDGVQRQQQTFEDLGLDGFLGVSTDEEQQQDRGYRGEVRDRAAAYQAEGIAPMLAEARARLELPSPDWLRDQRDGNVSWEDALSGYLD